MCAPFIGGAWSATMAVTAEFGIPIPDEGGTWSFAKRGHVDLA